MFGMITDAFRVVRSFIPIGDPTPQPFGKYQGQNFSSVRSYLSSLKADEVCAFSLGDKEAYTAWYNSDFGSVIIQDTAAWERQAAEDKLGIQLNELGEIISVYVGKDQVKDIPEEMYERLDALKDYAEGEIDAKSLNFRIVDIVKKAITEENRAIAEENKVEAESLSKGRVIVYMSITGHPTHLGHMAVVAAAISRLVERGFEVTQAFISLGQQWYLEGKLNKDDPRLSFEVRKNILEETIAYAAAQNMFNGVPVAYTDLEQRKGDHPPVYKYLKETNPDQSVFFVCGPDLYPKTATGMDHVMIVGREGEKAPNLAKNKDHELLEPHYPQYAHYSSTKIRKGEISLEPESLDQYFRKHYQVSQRAGE